MLLFFVIDKRRLIGLQINPDLGIRKILEVPDGRQGLDAQNRLDLPGLGW
jgi:hypothetical protein